ncbi:MAG: general secretion pathway protein GspB [Deltaproteobacteria bacterium]|nr:general secretion pathway protein GspB [Deltaproteobacteria bacterium]
MSAILKALKKIEQESSGEARNVFLSGDLDAKKVINQRARKAWILRRLMSVFVTFLIVAAILALVIGLKPFFPKGAVFLSSFLHGFGEEKKLEKISESEKVKKYEQLPEGRLEKRTTQKASSALGSSIGFSKKQNQNVLSAEMSGKVNNPYEGSKPSVRFVEMHSDSEPYPSLSVQAIVWSDNPVSRFTVINGHIVRSGGIVEGVTVEEIGPDSVSLKLGNKKWTLKVLEEK